MDWGGELEQTIEVPQSTSMLHYVEKGHFENAYKVACLGVTEADWRMLALAALKGQSWDVAKKGFIRIRDVCYLDLLHRLEQGHCSTVQKSTLGALVLAYQVSDGYLALTSTLLPVIPLEIIEIECYFLQKKRGKTS